MEIGSYIYLYMTYSVWVAPVAQSVERSAVNRKVAGSNPAMSEIFAEY